MQKVAMSIGVIIIILGVGYLVTRSGAEPTPPANTSAPAPAGEQNVNSETELPIEDSLPAETEQTASTPTTPGTYQSYDAAKIAQSEADRIFLFFHATWCPSCRALDADITTNQDRIPPGVEIYKLDYDTETALKRQYGITSQHSIVEITATGERVSSVTHPLTFSQLMSAL